MKRCCGILCILICISLCGCSQIDGLMEKVVPGGLVTSAWIQSRLNKLNTSDFEERREECFQAVFAAIEAEDCDAIYEMFSPNAQAEVETLKEDIQALFDLFDGKVISHKSVGGNEYESNEHGVKVITSGYAFEVKTENETYFLGMSENVRDDENTDNLGLCRILAYNDADEENTAIEIGIPQE